jgi:hypothetical protein
LSVLARRERVAEMFTVTPRTANEGPRGRSTEERAEVKDFYCEATLSI